MTLRTACCAVFFLIILAVLPARDFYWESPEVAGAENSVFPASATNGSVSAVVWQDIEVSGRGAGSIWLSCRVYDGKSWRILNRFAGPFSYSGEIPSIVSVALDTKNRILIPAVTDVDVVTVFISEDLGKSFTQSKINGKNIGLVGPRIFVRGDGGYFLFATRGTEDTFTLVYSRSEAGDRWQDFQPFSASEGLRRAFLPTHSATNGKDIVLFQAFNEGTGRASYQLYASTSTDSGRNWTPPVLVTGFPEPSLPAGSSDARSELYHNQRPQLRKTGKDISLVWERARTSNEKYAIYYTTINPETLSANQIERVSLGDGYCYDPDIILFDGAPAVVWFDNRRGVNRVYMALKDGFLWDEIDLSRSKDNAVFGRIVNVGSNVEVYWQQATSKGRNRIVRLSPDFSASPPSIAALNFTDGGKGRNDLVQTRIAIPEDSSGIAGYSYSWAQDTAAPVPEFIQKLPDETRLDVTANEDGTWYLGVRVVDYAGNWSEPRYVEYSRDTTPPKAPNFAPLNRNEGGYLSSNTFSAQWAPAEDDDLAGYTWNLEYLASLQELNTIIRNEALNAAQSGQEIPQQLDLKTLVESRFQPSAPRSQVRIKEPVVSFSNRDNGLYALSISAVDSVGNVGKPTVQYFALDKYIPYTIITRVDSLVDDFGELSVSILGRGFTDEGTITAIYLDRDGTAPWDRLLTQKDGDFKVLHDRFITGIQLSDMEEGSYRIVIQHPVRGRYVSSPLVAITSSGTVKLGDYRYTFEPNWGIATRDTGFGITPATVLLVSIFAFALLILVVSSYGITTSARDSVMIHNEVRALITGDVMPFEKKKKLVSLRRKGLGLRFKLSFFTTTLVISVVLLVSIPIGLQFSQNQERTLVQGLESRVQVLLESLASGARAYLPSQNVLELGFLPEQIAALSEARYATITGSNATSSATGVDFVWATNDSEIQEWISTEGLIPGQSRLLRPENKGIDERVSVLNEQAKKSVGELSEGISTLTKEGIRLALSTDAESVQRRDEIQVITRQLEEKLNSELQALSVSGSGSFPEYNPNELSRENTDYIFYKPVLYRQGTSDQYVHGTVRVEISTESLLKAVDLDREALVQTTAYIALFAVLIGVLGALALASIIISPIRRLAAHVAMIRDTEDKEELDGKDLKITSRDEIGLLGETINDMTRGLVRAASASKDLTVGKEIQKMFIPLDTDDSGRKLTCGSSLDDHAEFFGYYEGAKGVSGDYFDYIKLDERHYAIIKCDVAGKGVPAALIMVEVATLFLDYFKDWTYKKDGYRLELIVSRINDLLESRGFKGRFAAFTLLILDAVSGLAHFCNAGDNLVHLYEAATKKVKTITLPESSAAGVFPSFMVDMKGGFKVSTLKIQAGDVLFLYTDGIEEAKRFFRTPDLNLYVCAEPGLEVDDLHGNHSVGQDNEELGADHVHEIIESVFARRKYTMTKWHNPEGDVAYDFDFTEGEGTLEEAIIALISIEKVFRMYSDPEAGEFERVQVDKRVDTFLGKYFVQYNKYCERRIDHPEFNEYRYYTHVREDDQYDDLTVLGVRKR
ncbi:MAG TPA: SpoIIE family protein phosphatase [Treponema sp.]|nr:SpoIIE family protein phosphatase [Treponema sp.]